jgi:CRISPR/Cas system endoribonuclease Cas6 (RAMP superfamily)
VERAFSGWRRADLVSVEGREPKVFSTSPAPPTVDHVEIRFLTPTELKSAGALVTQPDFATLASRICDRIGMLSARYGEGPLDLDFRGLRERAAQVRLLHCQLQHASATRLSSRTHQVHPLSGFTGAACYAGELTEFMPLLRIAEWTGAGRQTVWGKGALKVHRLRRIA